MRFKTDENLPVDVVHFLRSEGHDVHSVIDQSNQTGAECAS